jgi:hypothetical protein
MYVGIYFIIISKNHKTNGKNTVLIKCVFHFVLQCLCETLPGETINCRVVVEMRSQMVTHI